MEWNVKMLSYRPLTSALCWWQNIELCELENVSYGNASQTSTLCKLHYIALHECILHFAYAFYIRSRLDHEIHYRVCSKFPNFSAKIGIIIFFCATRLCEKTSRKWIKSVMVAGFVKLCPPSFNDKAVSSLCVLFALLPSSICHFLFDFQHQRRVNVLLLLSEWIKAGSIKRNK